MKTGRIFKTGVICAAVVMSLVKLSAQELATPTPYFFARSDVGVANLEQSWDGNILHVEPRYSENPLPASFWNVSTRKKLSSSSQPVDFTVHNKILSEDDGFYCVLDLKSDKRVRLQNKKAVVYWPEHQFSPDGTRLTLELGGIVSTWDVESGKRLHEVRCAAATTSINDVGPMLSPDSNLIAVIDRGMDSTGNSEFQLKLVDVQTGKKKFDLPQLQYHLIGFSPDSSIFWAHSSRDFYKDTQVRFWDARSGKFLWSTKEYEGVHFSPDSQFYGAPREKDFAIYEARTGRLARRLSGPTSYNCRAWNFSFNGKHIWSVNRDGGIWQRSAE